MDTRSDAPEDGELDRFQAWLDRFGCRLEHWPENEAEAARLLLGRSAAARACLDGARRLDHWIASGAAPVPSTALKNRILGQAEGISAPSGPDFPAAFRPAWWKPAAGLAAAALVGVWIGLALPGGAAPADTDAGAAEEVALLAFAAEAGLEEVE